jgi:hypothetical protein
METQYTSTHLLGTPLKDPYPISGRYSFKGEGCNTQVLLKALAKGTHLCPTYPICKNWKVKALKALESW